MAEGGIEGQEQHGARARRVHKLAGVVATALREWREQDGPMAPWEWAVLRATVEAQANSGGWLAEWELHQVWCRELRNAGWMHGPIVNAGAKIHPRLCLFEELSIAARRELELQRAIVEALRYA